jgi:metallophosphoesterase (TIGR00282 family)
MDTLLDKLKKKHKAIFVDFHAEATSEKIAMGWHLDGRVSAVVGTHTHVQTHDERVLPLGTGYVTDVGMTGARDGILGMEREAVLQKFKTQLPTRFIADEGKWQLHGVFIELDAEKGLTKKIELIRRFETEALFD